MNRRALVISLLLALAVAIPARILSQSASRVTSPRQQFGTNIGDDYFLANYTQLEQYWQTLDRESDRLQLVDIGRTEEGRHQWMAVITAPENVAQLDRYRDISRRLSLAQDVDDEQARVLAEEGKAVVWIDGGLHADETLGAQQLIELVYQLTSRSDPETLRILHDTIVLAVQANPDGQELVANWYMREKEPQRRSLDGLPRLYQKYVGHDNNRDFYMSTQAETVNINRVLYRQWFPQIVYDHHQPGPAGTVMFAPPFRGPSNYVFDPLVSFGIDALGAAMQTRFAAENKAGVTLRSGSTYSTWWNGGLRTTAYFHNQIGLLTETIGDPAPIDIPFVAERQRPSPDLPSPIMPQPWHLRQSIEYSMTANRAVLDYAARHREELLFDGYRMGENAIERGRRDTWTSSPRVTSGRVHDPKLRDPRGYILPSDQPDFPTAVKFVDALLKDGVRVERATSSFTVGTRTYPAGSFIVSTAQAFRPHVLDMFEPQDYPTDVRQAGGIPDAPYDNAGWTLAFQMGVKFDRILDAFSGPFEAVTSVKPPPAQVSGPARPAGYLFSHAVNDSFIVLNRLLAAGQDVYWRRDGSMWVRFTPAITPIVERAASELGVEFTGVAAPGPALKVRPVRIGLWDQYGGSVSSGWIRWILERFEFPFERVYVEALDAGDLTRRYDVIILPDDAIPQSRSRRQDGTSIEDLPAEYRGTTGTMTWERTVPQLKRFVDDGGTLVTIGRANAIAERIGAPVADAEVVSGGGAERPLRRDELDVPGSIVRMNVDNTSPLAYGMERQADVVFDNGPLFRVPRCSSGEAECQSARVIARFNATPLRSGFAVGQEILAHTPAAIDVRLARGHVVMFGPDITFRAQSHGTFKLLFNAVFADKAIPSTITPPP
ncbi:MAG TPA: M14 metallopeptidase family protein [Vicinamibacterales bacterium]|nr:M14 metallopeptidase family protein [Vicinamibacterales bacterium]